MLDEAFTETEFARETKYKPTRVIANDNEFS